MTVPTALHSKQSLLAEDGESSEVDGIVVLDRESAMLFCRDIRR